MLSGRRLDLLDPSPLDVEIADIAHGLARVARWNGQTSGAHIFSVAQHTLLVEAIARRRVSLDRRARLAIMLHDAPEYVIGDMITPFKSVIGDSYRAVESRLLAAIHLRFGLPPALPAELIAADQERRPRRRLSGGHAACGFRRSRGEALFRRAARGSGLAGARLSDALEREGCRNALFEGIRQDFAAECTGAIEAPMIHVCSLARLHDTVRETGARHVVTLIKDISLVHRPATISAENHLLLDMDDITDHIEGYVAPAEEHVGDLLRFVRAWPREAPLVVHCYAGISRSTAGAFVTACALNPQRNE